MSENSLILNVQGAQHVLRPGVVLLGSTTNGRYRTILVDDKSICPKHASIRYDPTTSDLAVIDLCSVGGVTVDQRPINALTWCKITTLSQILIGTVPVSIEREVSRSKAGDDSVAFLLDEDSNDFIDCSLEETQLLPGRKGTKLASSPLSGSHGVGTSTVENITPSTSRKLLEENRTDRASSFLVPATQQLEDSPISTVANESLPSVKPCVVILTSIDPKSVPDKETAAATIDLEELEDDEDFFIIPETQQPCDDNFSPSPTIGRIDPVVLGSERAERTQAEEEYFQMTDQGDENSNDGLFNNMYVEGSQNLLQNMDESYKRVDAAVETRKQSIHPECSVDSISFQEHRNTTQDMSRLEWNETRPGHEQSPVSKIASPTVRKEAETQTISPPEEDDRSITPELHFDEPGKEDRQREGSVTPEVDFDKVLGEAEPKPPERVAALGNVEVEDNEHEISLNQEGCNELPNEEVSIADGSKRVEDIYDIETQVLDFDREDALAEQDAPKKVVAAAVVEPLNASPSKEHSKADVCGYDMETQLLNFDDDGVGVAHPYDLLTQPMESPKRSSFMGPPKTPLFGERTGVTRRSKQPSPTVALAPDEFLTQPMIPPASLRNLFAKEKATDPEPSTSSRMGHNLAEVETEPMSPPGRFGRGASSPSIDPADLLTQPMSPPKYLQGDGFSAWKTPASRSFDAYDQPTQPLNRLLATSSTAEEREENWKATLGSKKPFVQVVDIQLTRSLQECSDPYALQTQPMLPEENEEKGNVYDQQTQPLVKVESIGRKMVGAEATMLEISRFDPQINSTVRYSQSGGPKQLKREELEISPSSNKENSTTDHHHGLESSGSDVEAEDMEEEDLDDDLCLAATLPVGELQDKEQRPVARVTGRSRKAAPTVVFKVPSAERAELLITPKPSIKGSRRSMELTEFLTPEHPLLSLPKPDSILMASGRMRELAASHSRSVKGSSKYPFNDSSSESDEEDRHAFKKTNVSVALERELEKVKEVSKQQKKNVEEKAEQAVGKRQEKKIGPVSKDKEKDGHSENGPKRRTEKGSSSSSSRRAKQNDPGEEPVKRSSREKTKQDDGKGRESSRGKEEKQKEKPTLHSSAETKHTEADSKRVFTRSGREVRPKHPYDTSESESERSVTRSGREVRPKNPIDTSESDSERVATRSGREVRQKHPIDTSNSDPRRVFTRSGREVRPKHPIDTSESESERVVTRNGREVRPKHQTIDTSGSDSERVVTRSGREVRPKLPIDASMDYQATSGKVIAPAATATAPRSLRTRLMKEPPRAPAQSDREEKKSRREESAVAPLGQRRESKRQKSVNHQHRSPSSSGEPPRKKTDMNERPRRQSTATKKVDGKSCSTTFGMLMGESGRNHPPDGRNGGLANVSATSSSAGSDGSTRPARSNRPKLIFTRMSPEPYRKCIARAGGKVVDIPELANVLVTDRIFRTYKFLCAVAKGIPIVGQSYLDALQAASEHDSVDPWKHILCDETTEMRYKFRLRDTLLKARTHKLFQDYTVFVTSSTQPPPSELYLILSCAGATPLKHPGQSVRHSDKLFVISDPSDAASWPLYKEKFSSIEIVSTEGFMLSIMQHSISFKKHRLM